MLDLEDTSKLPKFLKQRRKNAELFINLFKDHPNYLIQKTIGKSSWFGFSLIIRPNSKIKRDNLVKILDKNKIECRPIVTGNFVRNEVMKYFDYKVHKKLKNADHLHYNGFMVGNSQNSLVKSLNLLKKILP